MKDLAGRIAVVTGGGTGMGRELVRQLAGQGCNVAICDISADMMAETRAICEADGSKGARITAHVADVSEEEQVNAFREAVEKEQQSDCIHLLFNNAGIGNTALGGGGSLFTSTREKWDRTFAVCWGGVYYNTRAFLPMLQRADAGHIVNTSSMNGLWASVGPRSPHTAYCTAKFAVRGFTEALITDLRVNAPHIKCSVVMPGHIGTSFVANSLKILHDDDEETLSPAAMARIRERLARDGRDVAGISDAEVAAVVAKGARRFQDDAPTTAVQAATIIIDAVKEGRWRILVGRDAEVIDELVRRSPERAYDDDFFATFVEESGWRLGG